MGDEFSTSQKSLFDFVLTILIYNKAVFSLQIRLVLVHFLCYDANLNYLTFLQMPE